MRLFQRHWLTVIGLISNLPSVWRGLIWLFDWEVRVETAVQKLDELGGVRGVIEFLVNPPPWLALVTLPVGLGLILYDYFRRRHPIETTALPTVARDQRAELIKNGRQLVIDATAQDGVATDFRAALENSPIYFSLRPYLSAQFLEKVRDRQTFIVPPPASRLPGLAHAFLNELDRLDRTKSAVASSPVERDMTMTACFHTLNDASEYPAFEDSLYQALYDGNVSGWGRQRISQFREDGCGPYHLIEKTYWKVGRLEWVPCCF
jgi:hypothetical protein